jgi:hypothetical protein
MIGANGRLVARKSVGLIVYPTGQSPIPCISSDAVDGHSNSNDQNRKSFNGRNGDTSPRRLARPLGKQTAEQGREISSAITEGDVGQE